MSKLLDNTIFEEKSCSINREKSEEDRKKGCTKKSKPGLAAGGCAFDGAQIVLLPIADVAHLVNGPILVVGAAGIIEGPGLVLQSCIGSGSQRI